jgi:putative addiction module component (TIGR02574 family)
MTPTIDAIFDAALSLPRENRATLAEKLADSLSEEDRADLSPAWAEEIRRRIAAYKRGEMKTIPAEQVMRSLSHGGKS